MMRTPIRFVLVAMLAMLVCKSAVVSPQAMPQRPAPTTSTPTVPSGPATRIPGIQAPQEVTSGRKTACDAATTCSGHGTCNNQGTCTCAAGFAGARCNQCAPGFTGATCGQCQSGYYGPQCARCPGTAGGPVCGGHGTCSDGKQGTGVCSCNAGYSGPSCSVRSGG
jgi:hypothetical protein